jgi:hypothetical protein
METEMFKEVGYGNDFTPETIPNLYKMIKQRMEEGLPIYGKAVLFEQVEGEVFPRRVGLTITHSGNIFDDEHAEYE